MLIFSSSTSVLFLWDADAEGDFPCLSPFFLSFTLDTHSHPPNTHEIPPLHTTTHTQTQLQAPALSSHCILQQHKLLCWASRQLFSPPETLYPTPAYPWTLPPSNFRVTIGGSGNTSRTTRTPNRVNHFLSLFKHTSSVVLLM